MNTQNITLTLPKEILRRVKIIAAQRRTSVSGLVTQVLQDLVTKEARYRRARSRHLALLAKGTDLGTRGQIHWSRDELHER